MLKSTVTHGSARASFAEARAVGCPENNLFLIQIKIY